MTLVSATLKAQDAVPDLSEFRRKYPLLVQNLGALAGREQWLKRIWELDYRWHEAAANPQTPQEVIVTGAPPSGAVITDEFEIIYAGGTLGLLHAGVMAHAFKRRVLVFDAHAVGKTHRDWNISDEELRAFESAGLFTRAETEAAVVNRYRAGFVKFHDQHSRFKTPRLWMQNVLDVALAANELLALAANKIRQSATDSLMLDGCRFVRAYVEPHRVTVETADAKSGVRRFYQARLFVDATGTNSPVARQLNNGRSVTHVCPTVGTEARGFTHGNASDEVNFSVGEILVSTEDARDHRQLIWEGFAGSRARDEYTTYLFFYDAVDSPADKSLLALFEQYFEKLPRYKRKGAGWRVVKPVFGYIPAIRHQGWRNQKLTSAARVLLVGDAAGLSSPLTFCGFGSHVRNLECLTRATERALREDALDANALAEINAYEPRVAQMASLAEFMRPRAGHNAATVNETMNAVMSALHDLDENVRRELFQDRMTFDALKKLLGRTAQIYPRVFKLMRENLGIKGSLWWLANIAEAWWHERRAAQASPDEMHIAEIEAAKPRVTIQLDTSLTNPHASGEKIILLNQNQARTTPEKSAHPAAQTSATKRANPNLTKN